MTQWMMARLNQASASQNPSSPNENLPQQAPEPIRFGQPGDSESATDVLSRLRKGRYEGWLTDALDHAGATNMLAREFIPINVREHSRFSLKHSTSIACDAMLCVHCLEPTCSVTLHAPSFVLGTWTG